MNRAISKILNKYLGDYIEKFNSDNLDVSLFSGKIHLENLRPKKEIFQLLGIPFDLKFAKLGKVDVKIPWGSLLSKPFIIDISEIFIYVTPTNPNTWSETSIKENLIKYKQICLDRFETMQEAEIEVNIPEFLKKWIGKIMENIQLTIKNVYIRYEDHLTSEFGFAFGVFFDEISLKSCDSSWENMHENNEKTFYKAAKISDFCIFCDHSVEGTKFQDNYTEDLETSFCEFASHDISGQVAHNYILVPFSLQAQITVSKTFSKDYPLLAADFSSESLNLNLHTDQVQASFQLLELIKLFLAFSGGIDKKVNEKVFSPEEKVLYETHYTEYRKAVKAEKKKRIEKYKKILSNMETEIKLDDIEKIREEVICYMNKEKLVNEKIKEIDKMRKKQKRIGIKGLFKGLKKMQYDEKMQRETEELTYAEEQLKDLLNKEKIKPEVEKKREKRIEDDNWLKVFISLSLKEFYVVLYHEERPMILTQFENLKFALGLKRSVFVDIQLHSIKIKDFVMKNSNFPYLFDLEHLALYLEEDPLSLEISCRDIYIFCLTETILKVSQTIKETVEKEVDISIYSYKVREMYGEYVKEGQDFVKTLFQPGDPKAISLKINCKAPVLIFPSEYATGSGFLIIDLGRTTCETTSLHENVQEFHFTLTDFSISIVWSCSSIKNWSSGLKDDLLAPFSITATMKQALRPLFPKIDLLVALSSIIISINPISLNFLHSLGQILSKLLPKIMVVQAATLKINEDILVRINSTMNIEIIPISIEAILDSIVIRINDINKKLCEAGVRDIQAKLQVKSNTDLDLEAGVTEFYIADKQPYSEFPEVFSDPIPGDFQIYLTVKVLSITKFTDVGIKVDRIKITLFSDFVLALIKFLVVNFDAIKLPKFSFHVAGGESSYAIENKEQLRLSIGCQYVEIFIPEKENPSAILFDFSVSLEYHKSIFSRTIFSTKALPLSTQVLLTTEDLTLQAKSFQGRFINTLKNTWSQLLFPMRVLFQLTAKQTESDILQHMDSYLDVETCSLQLSLDDIFIFLRLAKDWEELPKPVFPRSYYLLLTQCDHLAIVVIDRNERSFANLASVYVRKAEVKYIQNETEDNVYIKTMLGVNYYNKNISEWEPGLEKSHFAVDLEMNSNDIKVKVRAKNSIKLNVSLPLLKIVAVILEKFLNKWKKKDYVAEEEETEQEIEYIIENNIDIDVYVWFIIGEQNEKWSVPQRSERRFTEAFVNKLRTLNHKNVKWTRLMGLQKPQTKLSYEFVGDERVFELFIKEDYIKVIKLDVLGWEFPCCVRNFSQGNKRIIRIETAVFVANNYENPPIFKSLETEMLKDLKSLFIPISSGTINISENRIAAVEGGKLIVEHNDYIVNDGEIVNIIELRPCFVVKNLLIHDVSIIQGSSIVQTILPGETAFCKFEPKYPHAIRIEGQEVITSEPVILFPNDNPIKHKVAFLENKKSSIIVSVEKGQKTEYPGFLQSSMHKIKKNLDHHSWVFKIYTKFIFKNHSQIGLNISGIEVRKGSQIYYSGKKIKIRCWALEGDSDKSDGFNINTVGLAGTAKITRNQGQIPKHNILGINITQPPGYLSHTKIVTFVPRFVLWNYLKLPLCVQQFSSDETTVYTLPTNVVSSSPNYLFFDLDNYEISKNIRISTNSSAWSSYFSIENLDDFQVSFPSSVGENEDTANYYDQEWYLPSETNNFYRFVRVLITTSDESTIQIVFLDPKDPDFRIINKTNEIIKVKQSGIGKSSIEIGPYKSIEWAWADSQVEKKRVKISNKIISQEYSLEKVKNYEKKAFGEASVSVVINGVTRELWVKSKEYQESKYKSQKAKNQGHYLMLRDGSEEAISNPRFATTGSLVPMRELENSMDDKLMKAIGTELKLYVDLILTDIGISIIDLKSVKAFYISVSNLETLGNCTIYTLAKKFKISSKLYFKIKSLQINAVNSSSKFPIILSTITINEKNEPNKDFLSLDIDHTVIIKENSSGKTEFKHKFDNLDIELGEVSIILQEENVYKALEFRNFLIPFSNIEQNRESIAMKIRNWVIEEPNCSEFMQAKAYFKSFRLRGFKFIVSFKQSPRRVIFDNDDYSVVLNLTRIIVSGLGSISNASFTFGEVQILNVFQCFKHFVMTLARQYIRQLAMQFYKLLGCIDLLRNPIGIVITLGSKAFDYITEPTKNLSEGQRNFFRGLAEGVRVLFRNLLSSFSN
ncbi:hypothetical protein SteCoe_15424 [Stentor coeruleus]|uniref:PH domain-containing protein n=1 Tax=Stentor coeruleus TaxID=5963 RepID=A0A1R2C3X6_9CILI|nr:hypothetical protein SteCoe_15424 [Stentor coeruleus]